MSCWRFERNQNITVRGNWMSFFKVIWYFLSAIQSWYIRVSHSNYIENCKKCTCVLRHIARQQYSQSSCNFRKIQNAGCLQLSEDKKMVLHWRKISYISFTYIFLVSSVFYLLKPYPYLRTSKLIFLTLKINSGTNPPL